MEVIDLSVFNGSMPSEECKVDGFDIIAQSMQIYDVPTTNRHLKQIKDCGGVLYLHKYVFSPDGQYISFAVAYPELQFLSDLNDILT